MTAQAATIDTTPFWHVLRNLHWGDMPNDLSEIDADWCRLKLTEYCAGALEESVDELTQSDLDLLAYDLRDVWHGIRCENAGRDWGWV